MKKARLISLIITLIVWFGMYYVALPPANLQSPDFWSFLIYLVITGVAINGWSIIQGIVSQKGGFKEFYKSFKYFIILALVLVCVYVGGYILSSPILRASAYRDLLKVENGDFTEDIDEVDYSTIPILDRASAELLSERKMGSMIDMVSQYEVSSYYSQINYKEKPVRVTPLEYGSAVKWLTNRSTGIPAYICIDMATQDVELVKLDEGIKYSPSEYFSRDLARYLRFRYPTIIFRSMNFEIDDNGVPYWICTAQEQRIGLFGGTDIKGAVLLNAITGEHKYYDAKDIPQWVDKVYDADLIVEQYDYYGTLKNGYINSILTQKGCLQTTEGYNYIALNDDVWMYSGITSVTGDESIVGFILANQRTKETKYYQISGAKEYSAMGSAEGQVQNLGYRATFPLLLNVAGEPTYFLALKDDAGLVKKYAMVNIEKYQIVAIGDTVFECEKNYRNIMSQSGIQSVPVEDAERISGTVEILKDVVEDGNSYVYITVSGDDGIYKINVAENPEVIRLGVGGKIEFSTYGGGTISEIFDIEIE